jgi:hypothetical protein
MQRQVGGRASGEGRHVNRLAMQISPNPCANTASAGRSGVRNHICDSGRLPARPYNPDLSQVQSSFLLMTRKFEPSLSFQYGSASTSRMARDLSRLP